MKNLFISNLHQKDVKHFTTNIGLFIRRKTDKPFKKLCNIFTNATIIRLEQERNQCDEEYFNNLECAFIPDTVYPLSDKKNANNIVLERYPVLEREESYIFVGNHTCPEDIETMLNIIDRNAYLILGSVETLKYNPEMYLSWLNGMIVFDILDPKARKDLVPKMERVLQTNSILIFPEGSHNYHPSNLINPLFEGAVRLALQTGKKIVPISLVRDDKRKVSFIDVGNPIDMCQLYQREQDCQSKKSEKEIIRYLNGYLRDKMATAVYHLIARHMKTIERKRYVDIGKYFVDGSVNDAFSKLKWKRDVFDAEYLTKKTEADREYGEVLHTLGNLRLRKKVLAETLLNNREYVLKEMDFEKRNIIYHMKNRFYAARNQK